MKLLLVTSVDPWTRSVSSVHRWSEAASALGHELLIYGWPHGEMPKLKYTRDLKDIDLALFAMQVTWDLPDMPDLAYLMDGLPRERRLVVDLWGRYNETIRLDHDFNHLAKVDGHMGWEWEDAFEAISDTILQPTLKPLRPSVKTFLFHGFDPAAVADPYRTAKEAAAAWSAAKKKYGGVYVGSNWQRWEQVRAFLEQFEKVRSQAGRFGLYGWDWTERPGWAIEQGLKGVDTDAALLKKFNVDAQQGIRFDEIVKLLGEGRFAPIFHRPLFRHLGIVTNRTFETFYADTLPVLMLPRDFVSSIYGPAALKLVPSADVSAFLKDALKDPEPYWDAVLKTRAHLAEHHSYAKRFGELLEYAKRPQTAGAAR